MITVTELTTEDRDAWDAYVRQAPAGLPMHLAGWQDVLQRTYGYRTGYVTAWESGRVVGVLPLFLVRSRLLGDTATSTPGGLCADSPEAADALMRQGVEIAGSWGAVRFRLHDTRVRWPGAMHSATHHEHWLRDVSMGSEALWNDLDGNLRRQVRKATRNGLRVDIDRTGSLLEPFYEVFSRFTHEAGTPVFGREFLQNVVAVFPAGFNIAVVWLEDEPIGGYFQLEMGDTVYGMWGAALREHLQLRPVHLAMWELLRDASENGFGRLDMGRSPASSNASNFKGQWGGVRAPVHQLVRRLNKGERVDAVANGIDENSRFQLFVRVWPKLPLSMTQYIGPRLRRHLPFA